MSFLKIFIIASSVLSFVPLHASRSDSFTLRGYSLFYSPSYDETYFVIDGTGSDGMGNPTPHGKRINNPVDFEWGYRIEGIYALNACFACGLQWTYLHANGRNTVSNFDNNPPQLWPTEVIPNVPHVPTPFSGTATSHIHVMYQKAECLFEEEIGRCICCRFSLREAVEWSYIRYNEQVEYSAEVGYENILYHAHTKGLGPQIGVVALCEPWIVWGWCPPNLSLKLMTTGSLIVANSKAKIRNRDALSSPNNVTQSSFWKLVPEWSIDIGIRYLTPLLSIDLGYELTTYFRGTSKLLFNDSANPGLSLNQYSDFYIQGIYLALGFTL